MPHITMVKDARRTDPTLRKKVLKFLEMLMSNDATPGLHIEPMINAKDPRARTGRVDDKYRAVLYRIAGGEEAHYVYAGTYNHDEAIRIARTKILYVNPVSGVLELIAQQAEEALNKAEQPNLTSSYTEPQQPAPSEATTALPTQQPTATEAPVSGSETTQNTTLPGAIEVADTFVNQLNRLGYTPDQLQNQIGIDPRYSTPAIAATTSSEFNRIVDEAPVWQGCVLLELQAGEPIEAVIETLTLQIRAEAATYLAEKRPSTDQAVIEAFDQPSTEAEFKTFDDFAELKQVVESGNFDLWRTYLHPEQRKYVRINDPKDPRGIKSKGPYRVSGGAGTGKTVVALHRTKYLYDQNPNRRIVLTTFNKTLTDVLHDQLNLLDDRIRTVNELGQPGVHVKNTDAIAAAIWRSATDQEKRAAVEKVLGSGRPIRHHTSTHVSSDSDWKTAIEDAETDLPDELLTTTFLDTEYVTVILGNLITTSRQYTKVPRPGRGTALNRGQRLALWKIIEFYRNNRDLSEGYTFPELLCLAAVVLQNRSEDTGTYSADHVIVDEAQDLTPAHWLLLRALVPDSQDDLFIAEDSHQRIYGQKFPLSRFGINIRGRARRLRLNYRTTAENLAYAMRMLDPEKWEDLESGEESHQYVSPRSGPQPKLMQFSTRIEEYDALAELLKRWRDQEGSLSDIAILVRTKSISNDVLQALDDRGIVAVQIEGSPHNSKNVPHIMTMFRAKGMEYKRVVLFEVNDKSVPLPNALRQVPFEELKDQQLRERSLLYVASTRARDELVVMWSGTKSSILPE
ncbi:3'-5' exonuclease [Rothia nasimurium]|uniref:3'-5' exonuclease n=1 Tax=Rothia nasimurium TaxID=85336 RepID=UPI003BA18544